MENRFTFSGISSEEIDNIIKNDSNIAEGNKRKYLYPQYLYELLLQKPNVNIEFINPDNVGAKEYNYEWTRAFHIFFYKLL
jgi:hypothetical protein